MMGGLARYNLREIQLPGDVASKRPAQADTVLIVEFSSRLGPPRINPAHALPRQRYMWMVVD